MTNRTKVNLSIDSILDLYNDFMTLYNMFGDLRYKNKANRILCKLRG